MLLFEKCQWFSEGLFLGLNQDQELSSSMSERECPALGSDSISGLCFLSLCTADLGWLLFLSHLALCLSSW